METTPASLGQVTPVSYKSEAAEPTYRLARGQSAELSGPTLQPPPGVNPAPPASTSELYNCGVVTRRAEGFWDGGKNFFSSIPGVAGLFEGGAGRAPFQSDHAFDGFISPLTNPFYFEDPRSLTEVRPLFLYQATPIRNSIFHGGDIEFAGMQARLALTDRLSVVMSKLGAIWIEPHNATPDFQTHAGFAEIMIGPKFTFLRCDSTGSLGAVGLNFDFPTGDRHVLQDTGSLTLEPYLSLGQRIYRFSFGTFYGMGTAGYNFATDNKRSDNFFTSLHLDLDYGDLHKIYPLVEVHWFHYTNNGKARDLTFEGRDLFNFGSRHVSGHDEVSVAVGARYKVNECLQLGLAAELPLTTKRDLMDYRITFDVILRY
jgi:hypothetical protein